MEGLPKLFILNRLKYSRNQLKWAKEAQKKGIHMSAKVDGEYPHGVKRNKFCFDQRTVLDNMYADTTTTLSGSETRNLELKMHVWEKNLFALYPLYLRDCAYSNPACLDATGRDGNLTMFQQNLRAAQAQMELEDFDPEEEISTRKKEHEGVYYNRIIQKQKLTKRTKAIFKAKREAIIKASEEGDGTALLEDIATSLAIAASKSGIDALIAKSFDEAVDFFSEAINQNSGRVEYYSKRSAAYLSSGKFDDARFDGEKCQTMRPNWIGGYVRAGDVYYIQQKYQLAFQEYLRGLTIISESILLTSRMFMAQKAMANSKNPKKMMALKVPINLLEKKAKKVVIPVHVDTFNPLTHKIDFITFKAWKKFLKRSQFRWTKFTSPKRCPDCLNGPVAEKLAPELIQQVTDLLAKDQAVPTDLRKRMDKARKDTNSWRLHQEQLATCRQKDQEMDENLPVGTARVIRDYVNHHDHDGSHVKCLHWVIRWRTEPNAPIQMLKARHYCSDSDTLSTGTTLSLSLSLSLSHTTTTTNITDTPHTLQ
jgi:hypothetical protein